MCSIRQRSPVFTPAGSRFQESDMSAWVSRLSTLNYHIKGKECCECNQIRIAQELLAFRAAVVAVTGLGFLLALGAIASCFAD
jgi:hypothetical protein